MTNEERFRVVEEFLLWVEEETYYEIGKDVQSDYGDGESNFYSIEMSALLKEYKEGFK